MSTSRKTTSPTPAALHRELARKLDALPKDIGVALMGLGALGVVIPGPVPLGASFILVGMAILSSGVIARFGGWLARRIPGTFRFLIEVIDRLFCDLNGRYPGSVRV